LSLLSDTALSDAELRLVLDVNLPEAILCTRAVGPHMLERRAGKVINISSYTGEAGTRRTAACAAQMVPLGRSGKLQEGGLLALYLAASASDDVIGQTLFLDGGLSLLDYYSFSSLNGTR
jgi:NAD(P)-dependent dehydrogenase (short-subunit alcohol dehydrogenase family)